MTNKKPVVVLVLVVVISSVLIKTATNILLPLSLTVLEKVYVTVVRNKLYCTVTTKMHTPLWPTYIFFFPFFLFLAGKGHFKEPLYMPRIIYAANDHGGKRVAISFFLLFLFSFFSDDISG